MTSIDPPNSGASSPANAGPTKGGDIRVEEIPLEDIEALLEAEDPEFTKELEAVRAVENDKDVNIEATVVSDEDGPGDKEIKESRIAKLRARVRMGIYTLKVNSKARLIAFGKASLVFLKTKPKEYALYSFAMSKVLAANAVIPLKAFKAANRVQKLGAITLIAISVITAWVLLSNLRGVWLPLLNEPILTNLGEQGEWTEEFDPEDGVENFYSAFPQEIHEFLFRKMKVNLKATGDSPNPMGAFEVIVQVDSKDTAIEVRDREVEFFDGLQRVFEEETFNDLETDLGKSKLKGNIKRELNQKLTQGWIKDVKLKTFILKP